MKRLVLACLLSGAMILPALAALNEGDTAPDFKVQASFAGKASGYSLKDALKKGPVVVYFFPTAYGGGCSVQAHAFAVNHDKFTAAGATIVGITLDSIARLNDFSADPDYCAGKFPVASDADGKVSKAFDLSVDDKNTTRKDKRGNQADSARVERTTFVISPSGKIVAVLGGLAPAVNVDKALEAVQKLAAVQH
jgi:peroxiredoxin